MKLEPVHIDSSESERIATLSFIAACMIVVIHATPAPESGSVLWWITRFLGGDGICRIAVPYFFVVSGFLLVGRINDVNWYRSSVRKRIHSLLIPYLIWLLIGLMVRFCIFIGASALGYQIGIGNPFCSFNLSKVGLDPFHNVGYLWYVRDLFVLVLFSPLFIYSYKWIGWMVVVVMSCVYLFYSSLGLTQGEMFDFFEYFLSLRGILYFMIGIGIRFSGRIWKSLRNDVISLVGLFVGVLGLWVKSYYVLKMNYSCANLIDCVAVPFLLIGFWGVGKYIHANKDLISLSFHVYLLHPIFLLLSIAILTILGLRTMQNTSVFIALLRSFFAIAMAITVSLMLKAYCKPLARIIFGGR